MADDKYLEECGCALSAGLRRQLIDSVLLASRPRSRRVLDDYSAGSVRPGYWVDVPVGHPWEYNEVRDEESVEYDYVECPYCCKEIPIRPSIPDSGTEQGETVP